MFATMKIRYFLLIGLLILVADLFIFGVSDEDWFSFGLSYTLLGFYPILWLKYQLKKRGRMLSTVIQPSGTVKRLPGLLYVVIVVMFFSFGAFWLLNFGLSFAFPGAVDFLLQEDELLPEGGMLFVWMVIYVGILGPVAEEIIFRGAVAEPSDSQTEPDCGTYHCQRTFWHNAHGHYRRVHFRSHDVFTLFQNK
ncbi:hypothetical protein RWE15_08860 [Virgibacillus halophilus]|uniref:CAAX protease self-immunity n=1 Tax=Tigheibacillus halophilus TaxID=361280 RepID=A0ABU5C5Q8_9BACI|nr:hypothetical protein [Virgibacillus halophilus]